MAWGEDPPSRTRHLVGNLVVEPQAGGEVSTKTAFIVYRSHHEDRGERVSRGTVKTFCAELTRIGE